MLLIQMILVFYSLQMYNNFYYEYNNKNWLQLSQVYRSVVFIIKITYTNLERSI